MQKTKKFIQKPRQTELDQGVRDVVGLTGREWSKAGEIRSVG